jgi:phosphoglycolate phosphatase
VIGRAGTAALFDASPAALPPARPRAVLFDWDNTLIDSWATIHEALNRALAAMGWPPWSFDETRRRARLSIRESFPARFGERWQEAAQLYLDHFQAIHLERLTPLPGRAELLQRLAAAGFYLGVVSNKTGPILRLEVERLGWSALFGGIVGAGDAVADKPHPAPVRLALEPGGLAPADDVWFVGDTGLDMACARNAGCVAVLLGEAADAAEFAEAAPQLAFADGASLFRFLQGL